MPSVIALDAMGSDRAPKPEVEGAIHAARNYGVRVLLIGPEATVKAELDRHPTASRLPIEIVQASEVITMEDKAVQAVRAKRDSSMRVGSRLVREGKAAAFISAGNTGAAMATAKMGEIYFRSMFGTARPRVGLLSIGEEEGKGNELTREAYPLLQQLPINFVGNVEGRDLYNGKLDVIVCDGF